MSEKQQILLRIFSSILISFLLFIIFSVKDGLFTFITLLSFIGLIDSLSILFKRKFKILFFSLIWYLLLTSFYYLLIDNGFRII